MKIKMIKVRNLVLLFILFFSARLYSQDTYQVGTSQVSIEPGKRVISLPLGGYAAPWEGRFTLQWVTRGQLSTYSAIEGTGNNLYLVSDNKLLRRNPSENHSAWNTAGKANNIRLLAGLDNKLFAVNNNGKLLKANAANEKFRWEEIGSVDHSVTALTAYEEKLYAANGSGSFWMGNISGSSVSWSEMVSSELNNIIGLTANERKLFALTKAGIIYQCDVSKPNKKWIKTAYKNGITIKEDIRDIAIAGNTMYGISKKNVLYEEEHRSKGDLSARAVAIQKGNNTVVIATVDLVSLSDDFIGLLKEEIYRKTGIPPSSVFINISHTHFAHVAQPWPTWQEHQQPDSVYLYSIVKEGMFHAIDNALKIMAPAEIYFGRGSTDIGYNRSLDDHPELYDDDVDVIKVDYTGNDAESYMFLAACHPVFGSGEKDHYTISANFPGVARRLVEDSTRTSNSLFLQGTAGDINPNDDNGDITGKKLADDVLGVLDRPMKKITGPISCYLDTLNIPITPWTRKELMDWREKNRSKSNDMVAERNVKWCNLMLNHYKEDKMPTSLPVYIHTVNIGNWKLVGFSRETTTGYSEAVKHLWPNKLVSVAGFTNDVSSYLPTHRHIREKNYEGLGSFFWYGMPNTFPETVDSTIINHIENLEH